MILRHLYTGASPKSSAAGSSPVSPSGGFGGASPGGAFGSGELTSTASFVPISPSSPTPASPTGNSTPGSAGGMSPGSLAQLWIAPSPPQRKTPRKEGLQSPALAAAPSLNGGAG